MPKTDLKDNAEYYTALTLTAAVLHHHPNQIVRHEAAFLLGEFGYKSDIDKSTAVWHLRLALRNDPSVVVKHEAAEAAGDIDSSSSILMAADMAKFLRAAAWREDARKNPTRSIPAIITRYHPDVVKTMEMSFDSLINKFLKRGWIREVVELMEMRVLA